MERNMKTLLGFVLLLALASPCFAQQDQTVFGKIEQAYQAGEIDRATALLYKLYAVKAPDRLPAEYGSDVPAICATVPLLDVWRNADFLARNKDGDVYDLLLRPTGLDSTKKTTHFVLHYTSHGSDSVGKWYVESLAVYAESSWTFLVTSKGWDAPPPDTSGPDSIYDIYINDIPSAGVLGYCATEKTGPDPQQEDATSYIVLDYALSAKYRKSTVAHEFNHACQFSYSYNEKDFWYENCAVWAQDEVYDGETDYYDFLGSGVDNPLTYPEDSLTHFTNSGYYQYGGVTWAKYLSESNSDLDIIRKIWDRNGKHSNDFTMQDTDSILKANYSDSLANAVKEYGVWRYFTGGTRAQSPYYQEGSSWTTCYVDPAHKHSSYPASGTAGSRGPQGYGVNYIEFDTTNFPGGLNISFNGQNGSYWGAMVIEYNDGGPSTFSQIPLDANGDGSKIVSWDSCKRLVLISTVLSSASSARTYTYSATFIPTDNDPPVVQVMHPNGGESISIGTIDTVRWVATDNVKVDSLSIWYSTDAGSSWLPVARGEKNDSAYLWTVPNSPSSTCLMKTKAWDWTAKWDEDTSDAVFTIGDFTPPTVKVVRPNGGEGLGIGLIDTVRWNASDNVAVDSLSIDYSTNAGTLWKLISTGEANDGKCPWLIPNEPSDSCLVRITAFDRSLLQTTDVSDSLFKIGDDIKPLVSIVAPNGGESFTPGQLDTIRWLAWDANGVDSVNLFYTTDSAKTWVVISRGEKNDSNYVWTVPNKPSNGCKVKAEAFDPAGNSGSDDSNAYFKIRDLVPPDVTLVVPNGGEQWEVGTIEQIQWIATDNVRVDSLSIYYSLTKTPPLYIRVTRGEKNDSSYDWSIHGPLSDSCLVRIIAYDFGSITDTTAPTVSVVHPNGGEDLNGGSMDTIRWIAADNYLIDSIGIYYSSNNGASWNVISIGEKNDSAYVWQVPAITSDSCLVRIRAIDHRLNLGEDQSNSVFRISDKSGPAVQVVSPNGGETLNVNEEDTIKWVATDLFGVDSVNLYYSTNNGGSWLVISNNEPNDSSYAWTVPDTPSDSCLVRVRAYDPSGNQGTDISNAVFIISDVGVAEMKVNRGRPTVLGLSLANPFRGKAVVKLALPQSGHTAVDVYDITGSLMANIYSGYLESGYHSIPWDGTNGDGKRLPEGVYFLRLESASGIAVAKGVLLNN
jgi:hypothetical protein